MFGNWINAGAKEGMSSSTGCEEPRTDMFVSCERLRECMMTGLICSRTYSPHTSRDSAGGCVSSNVTAGKVKLDEGRRWRASSRIHPFPRATWVTLEKQFLYVPYFFHPEGLDQTSSLRNLWTKQLPWWCYKKQCVSHGNVHAGTRCTSFQRVRGFLTGCELWSPTSNLLLLCSLSCSIMCVLNAWPFIRRLTHGEWEHVGVLG